MTPPTPPLATGPYKINGVPIRRLNQAYVIATSTKIDVSGVDVSKINDDFFKRPAAEAKKGDSEEFFKKEEVATRDTHRLSAPHLTYTHTNLPAYFWVLRPPLSLSFLLSTHLVTFPILSQHPCLVLPPLLSCL